MTSRSSRSKAAEDPFEGRPLYAFDDKTSRWLKGICTKHHVWYGGQHAQAEVKLKLSDGTETKFLPRFQTPQPADYVSEVEDEDESDDDAGPELLAREPAPLPTTPSAPPAAKRRRHLDLPAAADRGAELPFPVLIEPARLQTTSRQPSLPSSLVLAAVAAAATAEAIEAGAIEPQQPTAAQSAELESEQPHFESDLFSDLASVASASDGGSCSASGRKRRAITGCCLLGPGGCLLPNCHSGQCQLADNPPPRRRTAAMSKVVTAKSGERRCALCPWDARALGSNPHPAFGDALLLCDKHHAALGGGKGATPTEHKRAQRKIGICEGKCSRATAKRATCWSLGCRQEGVRHSCAVCGGGGGGDEEVQLCPQPDCLAWRHASCAKLLTCRVKVLWESPSSWQWGTASVRPLTGGGKVTVTYDDGTGDHEEDLDELNIDGRVEWLLPLRDPGCVCSTRRLDATAHIAPFVENFVACAVCTHWESPDDDNRIVYCSGCGAAVCVAVHEGCADLNTDVAQNLPSGGDAEFECDACVARRAGEPEPSCSLCPRPGGFLFKERAGPKKGDFVHVACVKCNTNLNFRKTDGAVTGRSKAAGTCSILGCPNPTKGAVARCGGCGQPSRKQGAAHISCLQRTIGWHVALHELGNGGLMQVELTCPSCADMALDASGKTLERVVRGEAADVLRAAEDARPFVLDADVADAPFTLIDAFCGYVGGFSHVCKRLGGVVVAACDADPEARKAYVEAHRLRREPLGDVLELGTHRAALQHSATVFCAGFVCKSFSQVSQRMSHGCLGGGGTEHAEHGGTFQKVIETLKARADKGLLEPILLLENVPEFVTMGAQGLTPAMWSQLRELGYYCTILIASARYFDCAVLRERMALVGFREEAHLTAFETKLPQAWTSHPRPVTDFLRPYTYDGNRELFLTKPEAFCKNRTRESTAVVLGAEASPPHLGVPSPTVSYDGPGSIGAFVAVHGEFKGVDFKSVAKLEGYQLAKLKFGDVRKLSALEYLLCFSYAEGEARSTYASEREARTAIGLTIAPNVFEAILASALAAIGKPEPLAELQARLEKRGLAGATGVELRECCTCGARPGAAHHANWCIKYRKYVRSAGAAARCEGEEDEEDLAPLELQRKNNMARNKMQLQDLGLG